MTQNDDEKLIQNAAAEMKDRADDPVLIETTLKNLIPVISILQLGLRHPATATMPTAKMAREFCEGLIEVIAPKISSDLHHLLMLGFDPAHDQ